MASSEESGHLADYDYVRFTVFDIHGIPRSKVVPARAAAKYLGPQGLSCSSIFNIGTPDCKMLLKEVNSLPSQAALGNCGNLCMVSDPVTLRAAPWAGPQEYRMAEVICNALRPQGIPDLGCGRSLANQQLEALLSDGYRLLSGIELEFVLKDPKSDLPLHSGVQVLSAQILSSNMRFLGRLDQDLATAGLGLDNMQVEHAEGGLEVNYQPHWGISGADTPAIIRTAIKEEAVKQGLTATFMSYSGNEGECGNGAHYNHSLWDYTGKDNIFLDPSSSQSCSPLSLLGENWLAGLMLHTPGLTALFCPTINCYRRLFNPWVPSTINWGVKDRFVAYRVRVEENQCGGGYCIENRIPSGLSNPYLVMAGVVAAGRDGLARRLSLGKEGESVGELPSCLEEALDYLQGDLVLRAALGGLGGLVLSTQEKRGGGERKGRD